jgi:hypothetical protein
MHLEQLAAARARSRPLTNAVRYAVFDAWGIAVFGGLTMITGLTSLPGLLLGCGMCIVAHFELRAASALRRLDPAAIDMLVRNQLILGCMLFAYGVWNLISALIGPSLLAHAAVSADVARMLQPFDSLARTISASVYIVIMLVAIFVQGGSALFYRSRRRHLADYLANTPIWILGMQQGGARI